MAELTDAATQAAQDVAQKVGGKGNKSSDEGAKSNNSAVSTTSGSSVLVPGLTDLQPGKISGMLPKFDENKYNVTDPLNPPKTIPQVTESQYNQREAIYQGGIRALKLTGLSFDLTRERFTTLGKQAKAFGAGIRAAKEFEIVKGDYLDWKNQLQTTEQKNIALSVSEYKTTTDSKTAVHTKATADEKLKQAEIGANHARAQTQQKQGQLDEFKKQLGDLAKAK